MHCNVAMTTDSGTVLLLYVYKNVIRIALCLLQVFLRHCRCLCFPPVFGRSDGQIIAGEEMFGPREPSSV